MKNNQLIVLITGGTSNLGNIISTYLSEHGHIVYCGYNSSVLKKVGANIHPVWLDVTNKHSIEAAISKIIRSYGRVNVLVNCAGISMSGKLEGSTVEEFDRLLEINTKGTYRMIQAALPIMKKQKSGKIINITSMSGLISLPNFAIYSASKFASEGLTTALRYEILKDNIWVTNIEPGAILNESNKRFSMPHKTFRERFWLAKMFLPLVRSSDIAQEVERVIESDKPPANVLVGRDVKLTYFAKRLLPTTVWDKLLQLTLA